MLGNVLLADLSPCGTLVAALTFGAFIEVYHSDSGCCLARQQLPPVVDFEQPRSRSCSRSCSRSRARDQEQLLQIDMRILRRSPHMATVVVVQNRKLFVHSIRLSNLNVSKGGVLSVKRSCQRCWSRLASCVQPGELGCTKRRARFRCDLIFKWLYASSLRQAMAVVIIWLLLVGICTVAPMVGVLMPASSGNGNGNSTTTAAVVVTPAAGATTFRDDVTTVVQHYLRG